MRFFDPVLRSLRHGLLAERRRSARPKSPPAEIFPRMPLPPMAASPPRSGAPNVSYKRADHLRQQSSPGAGASVTASNLGRQSYGRCLGLRFARGFFRRAFAREGTISLEVVAGGLLNLNNRANMFRFFGAASAAGSSAAGSAISLACAASSYCVSSTAAGSAKSSANASAADGSLLAGIRPCRQFPRRASHRSVSLQRPIPPSYFRRRSFRALVGSLRAFFLIFAWK